jgi:hypothetical protein
MSITRRLAVVLTAVGTVSAGFVSGATTTTAAGAGPAAGGQRVHVVIKRDHTIVMPRSIRPGVTTFKIASRRNAQLQLVRPAADYTRRELARDANAAFTKNNLRALRRFEANTTLYGGMPSAPGERGVVSVDLPAGSYWALDVQPSLIRAVDVKRFTVTGDSVGGTLTGITIAAVGEHAWARSPRRIPTSGRILFDNPSDANHFLVLAKLRKGKTAKDFATWVKRGARGAPPVSDEGGLNTSVISGGVSMSFPYQLARGRYVLICPWPDADEGGRPHFLLGMYRGLRVR